MVEFPCSDGPRGRISGLEYFFPLGPYLSDPGCQIEFKERLNMTNEQMELGFGGAKLAVQGGRREGKIQRAAWWFAQMRQIVNSAMDWQPAGEPRPEQIWLPGEDRQVRV